MNADLAREEGHSHSCQQNCTKLLGQIQGVKRVCACVPSWTYRIKLNINRKNTIAKQDPSLSNF